jgi:hypothetical protein
VGLAINPPSARDLYAISKDNVTSVQHVDNINAYLVPAKDIIVEKITRPLSLLSEMSFGNKPTDGGHLLLDRTEVEALNLNDTLRRKIVRRFIGSEDSINGKERFCLWLSGNDAIGLSKNSAITKRLASVKKMRLESDKQQTNDLAEVPFRFGEIRQSGIEIPFIVPRVSSESRQYLPFAMGHAGDIVSDTASALYNAPLWNIALYASRLHLMWIATVCGKLKTDFRYSNTLGWNTFPVPTLTEQNKIDLTRTVEDILLAREAHFPKTIADLYDPDDMPDNLRRAHDANDEVLERIYIGRRFKNDTERLEKLFELYTKMTGAKASGGKAA